MKNLKDVRLLVIDLGLFTNTNKTTDTTATTGNDLSPEMRTYYSDYLIDLAEPELVHDQFGQKHPIPKNGGKTIQFRKYDSLPKLLTPLSEGVTPDGQKLNTSTLEATVYQYGGYVELSDVLLLTAVDNNLVEATELLASQAGRTLDTITREVLNGGTNVQYGAGSVKFRHKLVGGAGSGNDYLTVDAIRRAVRFLKVMNAKKINGDYVGIIHPDTDYDLTSDPEWKNPHTYVDTANIYNGEIGKIAGVRFVETTEAKVFHAENLTAAARNLTVKTQISSATTTVAVKEAISADEATALAGRNVIINGNLYEIASANSGAANAASIVLTESISSAAVNDVVYPGEAGAAGRDIYSTLILGANAYGVTEITGGGLQHIVKQLGSAGTADPLNQRATAGWKAMKTAERLIEQYMIRIETASTFELGEAN
jgi:N4-gp56 family major capsid protein